MIKLSPKVIAVVARVKTLTRNQKVLTVLMVVAVLVLAGCYGWHIHKHKKPVSNTVSVQPVINLAVSTPNDLVVAFLTQYGQLSTNKQQQANLVSSYGTNDMVAQYNKHKSDPQDPVLCGRSVLGAVSVTGSTTYGNGGMLYNVNLTFVDGTATQQYTVVSHQVGGYKIQQTSCQLHGNDKPTTRKNSDGNVLQVVE